MGKSTRFLESSATVEENSHDWIVEWDDFVRFDKKTLDFIHTGPGSRIYYHDYDNAWEDYSRSKESKMYKI